MREHIPVEGFHEYGDKVFEYLEYLDYPELVSMFEVKDVAKSLHGAMFEMWLRGESTRMAAIIIFSLTMNMQVIPTVKEMIKH